MTIEELKYKFGVPVTYLNPDSEEASTTFSKMGGKESLLIEEIDVCKSCTEKRTLILELYKSEFTEAYFEEDTNYCQVKTCYNPNCENYEIEFKIGFGNLNSLAKNEKDSIVKLDEFYLRPDRKYEIPYDNMNTELITIQNELTMEVFEKLIKNDTPKIGTKINGEPFSWYQEEPIKCECGNYLTQILQISSIEPSIEDKNSEQARDYDIHSSIGIFIGKNRNYHFFTCRHCNSGKIVERYDSM